MPMHRRRVLALLMAVPVIAVAQAPVRLPLKPANATLAHEFSSVIGLRELPDGRILVTDRIEKRVVVGNFATNTVAPVGRTGDGPGEYRAVSDLTPMRGDSTLMANSLARRWVILAGDRAVATLPADWPMVGTEYPFGIDAQGRVVTQRAGRVLQDGSPASVSDSNVVVRMSITTGRMIDTIARLYPGPSLRDGTPPFAAYEFAKLSPDGWMAVPRLTPYRVDWMSPSGAWTRGPVIPDGALPLTAADRATILRRRESSLPKGVKVPPITDWPATIPPFRSSNGTFTTWQGQIVIERAQFERGKVGPYDVIDRRGRREGQIVLPAGQRIIGFGAHAIYLVVADDDGIEKIERHPWP